MATSPASKPNIWKEYFIYAALRVLTPGVGTQAFDTTVVRTDSDSDFEFSKLTYVANSDRIKLRMRDEATGRYLIKNPVDIKSIFGRNTLPIGQSNSFLPFILPGPVVIPAASNLTLEMQDYSNVANTLRVAFHGAKVRQGQAPWERKFKARVFNMVGFTAPVTIPANATVSQNIEIDVDAHFLVQKIVGIRTSDALINISEAARGRSWMNTSMHIDNVVGNAVFPNILPAPRFISRGSVVTVNLQDLSGNANTVEVTLVGHKLYE